MAKSRTPADEVTATIDLVMSGIAYPTKAQIKARQKEMAQQRKGAK